MQGKYFQSLMIMLLISMSDIIDGMVAKQAENNCKGGDIFDIVADFMVVLSIFVLCFSGITVIIFTRLYFKEIYISLQNPVIIIISIYLIMSIIENIRSIIKEVRYEQKR